MRKSPIFLSLAFAAAVTACQQQDDQWITGAGPAGATRDTVRQGQTYRHYHGSWYPVYNGLISPNTYQGASAREIGRTGYAPTRVSTWHSSGSSHGSSIHSGGFGGTAHGSFGG